MTSAYLVLTMSFIRCQILAQNWARRKLANLLANILAFCQDIGRVLDTLTRNIERLALFGLALNVLSYFWPELPSQIPVIYGICNGMLQFLEFLIKVALGCIYAVFNGSFNSFWIEYKEAVLQMMQQAGNWLASLHF